MQLVSVIVPIYNVYPYLKECIDSIRDQSYTNIEIILVDDGSTDNSLSICNKEKEIDKRIKVYHKKNGGLVSAWKLGVNYSNGELICFVDSDDKIQRDHIKDMVYAYLKYKVDLVISNVYRLEENKLKKSNYPFKSGLYSDYREEILPIILNSNTKNSERYFPPNRWGKLFERKLILNNLKYVDDRVSYAEDLSLVFPIFCDINNVFVIKDKNNSYLYRVRKNSMIEGYDNNLWNSIKIVYPNLKKALNDKSKRLPKAMYEQLKIDYVKSIIKCYKNIFKSSHKNIQKSKLLKFQINKERIFSNVKVRELKNFSLIDKLVVLSIFSNHNLSMFFLYYLLDFYYFIKKL